MKYTISINQQAVVSMGLNVDFIDLCIYDCITSFMFTEQCRKVTIQNETYYWVSPSLIISEMPLLGISTERGINKRIDNLVEAGLLMRCPDNQSLKASYYKVGSNYSKYMFSTWNENSNSTWNESSNNNNTIDNNKKDKDKSLSKKDDFFEQCWKEYKRKGSKAKAKIQWNKLSQEEKDKVITHIKAYVQSRELQYQKDFERYLKDKIFDTLVIANNNIIYDPTMFNANEYRPTLTSQLFFQNELRTYIYIGFWDGFISDGYNDNNRPNGASIMLNNGRGTIIWNKNSKQWILTK